MKRLVMCCDGTWNTPRGGSDATNVWKLRTAVAPTGADGLEQRVYYQPGVGTSQSGRLRGGLFGRGLAENVRDAYGWVVENFEPGDALFLLGFSRGAYTARSLAGLIRNCGVLRPEAAGRIGAAFRLYRNREPAAHPNGEQAMAFRRAHSVESRIAFLGVFDTVGALGIPIGSTPLLGGFARVRWGFHDVQLSSSVDVAVQALAVDERRAAFRPTLWAKPVHPGNRVLEQVWFVGAHSNVGGGYAESQLSDLALEYMRDRAERAGLTFRPGTEPVRDLYGNIADSRGGFWRWLPAATRPIGLLPDPDGIGGPGGPDPSQSLHASVEERRAWQPGYAPKNLAKYLTDHQSKV
ncbi:MAG: DUF2235 domain-containing protein [Sporichthyaceae bacterium]